MSTEATDEIDLIQLFVKFFKTLKERLVLIIVCTLVGTLVSWGLYTTKPKVYESRMLIYSEVLTEPYLEKIGNDIAELINEKNISLLAEKLFLTEEEAKAFVAISIESSRREQTTFNKEKEDELFAVVNVEVLDNAVLPKLQNALIKHIEQNEFVKVRGEYKKKYYSELVNKVSNEIEKMEVIKNQIGQGTFKSNGGTYLVDPANLFSESMRLFQARLEYQEKLELGNSVQLMEGFTAFDRKIKPKFSVMLPIGFLAGVFLAFGIIFLQYVIKLTNER